MGGLAEAREQATVVAGAGGQHDVARRLPVNLSHFAGAEVARPASCCLARAVPGVLRQAA